MFGRTSKKDSLNLIKHLKEDKRMLRNGADASLRAAIEAESIATIDFMCRNGDLSIHPYMFVNSKGKILGYTSGLETALALRGDVRGKNYLDIFYPKGDIEKTTELRKYFSSPREIIIDYNTKIGRKKKELRIIKEAPVYTAEIELESIRSKKIFRTVAFVPIRVGPKINSLKKSIGLFLNNKKEIKAQVDKASVDLYLNHGWPFEKSQEYMVTHGTNGLLEKYKQLEKGSI